MTRKKPYAQAIRIASDIIRESKITVLPVDPIAIASLHNIEVMAKPGNSSGVSGMLIRQGENYGIAYSTHIDSDGFQRFSIAHELGHYFLPGHIDALFTAGNIHESYAGYSSENSYEIEADHFAASLLMPQSLVEIEMRKVGEGLNAIEYLAQKCQTSLTASAIRFTQLSKDSIAIVVSSGSLIDYCFMSDALKDVRGIDWIRKGQAVPKGTTTCAFNSSADKVKQSERMKGTSVLQDWFGGSRNIKINEDVIGLGTYGKTLTVLYGIELPDEEEEYEGERLKESWEPKF